MHDTRTSPSPPQRPPRYTGKQYYSNAWQQSSTTGTPRHGSLRSDFRRAFLQSNLLTEELYMKPPREARVPHNMIWQVLRGVDGRVDSMYQWGSATLIPYLLAHGMTKTPTDPRLPTCSDSQGKLQRPVVARPHQQWDQKPLITSSPWAVGHESFGVA